MRPTWKKIYYPDGRREVCPDGYRNQAVLFIQFPPPPTDIWENLPQYLLSNVLREYQTRYQIDKKIDLENPCGFQMGDGPG